MVSLREGVYNCIVYSTVHEAKYKKVHNVYLLPLRPPVRPPVPKTAKAYMLAVHCKFGHETSLCIIEIRTIISAKSKTLLLPQIKSNFLFWLDTVLNSPLWYLNWDYVVTKRNSQNSVPYGLQQNPYPLPPMCLIFLHVEASHWSTDFFLGGRGIYNLLSLWFTTEVYSSIWKYLVGIWEGHLAHNFLEINKSEIVCRVGMLCQCRCSMDKHIFLQLLLLFIIKK